LERVLSPDVDFRLANALGGGTEEALRWNRFTRWAPWLDEFAAVHL